MTDLPRDFAEDILPFIEAPSRRADVVPLYATAILLECFARPQQAQTRWRVVNNAIAARWSWSAVTWIKRHAWRRAEVRAETLCVAAKKAVERRS